MGTVSALVAPAAKSVPRTFPDTGAWFRFLQGLFSIGSALKVQIQYQLELLGQHGYDALSQYFCDEVKPVRKLENLKVGDEVERKIEITKWRVFFFALVSGDWNRLHFDPEFAAKTRFGGTIGHGLLIGGAVSALLGMELPGLGTYYVSQSWRFKGPTKIGDEVLVRVTIASVDLEKRRVTLTTTARVDDRIIAAGEAVAGIDDFPYKAS